MAIANKANTQKQHPNHLIQGT